jgi:hypothetical protein
MLTALIQRWGAATAAFQPLLRQSWVGNKLKKAKKVIIEKTRYEAGESQFEFDVAGLKWEH